MEGTLPADQSEAFSATRERKPVDRSHTDRREVLDAMPIATEKELKGGL